MSTSFPSDGEQGRHLKFPATTDTYELRAGRETCSARERLYEVPPVCGRC